MAHYRVELTPDDNGTLLVTCPALPEVATYGETEAAALAFAALAVEEALAARLASNQEVLGWSASNPIGGHAVTIPTLKALKVSLHRTLLGQGLTRAELARRLGWHREQVDRLFRLNHASRMDQMESAFAALGHRVTVMSVEAA